jgi:hypothetical protein
MVNGLRLVCADGEKEANVNQGVRTPGGRPKKPVASRVGGKILLDRFVKLFWMNRLQHNRFHRERTKRRRSRQDHYGDIEKRRIARLMLQKFPAIHHGHHQVQNDKPWPRESLQIIERFATIGGPHNRVTSILQQLGQRLGTVNVIVNQHYVSPNGQAAFRNVHKSFLTCLTYTQEEPG